MLGYIVKRSVLMVITLLGIITMTFAIIHLAPGDPAELRQQSSSHLQSETAASKIIADTRKLYGLDKPIYMQYGIWLMRVFSLDFGHSYHDHRPVWDKIKEALPITIALNIIVLCIIYIVSIPVGIYAAIKPRTLMDRLSSIIMLILYSLPSFWVAMMLIVLLSGGDYANVFPIIGIVSDNWHELSLFGKIGNVIWHLILPIICLSYGGFAFLSRFSRATMLDILQQDYIRTARAKGLSEWAVILKHGLRNAGIPLITLMGTLLPSLIGGSVIIEQIFSIPGMGRLGFESVLSRDYPVIMAISVLSATLTLISMFISDLLYMWVDPRIDLSASKRI